MIVFENVSQLATYDNKRTINKITDPLDGLAYKTGRKTLNALDYGLPKKRGHALIVGFL